MKKSRYSDSQMMAMLKQAEAGSPAPELGSVWRDKVFSADNDPHQPQ
jgi:hypothetical protein